MFERLGWGVHCLNVFKTLPPLTSCQFLLCKPTTCLSVTCFQAWEPQACPPVSLHSSFKTARLQPAIQLVSLQPSSVSESANHQPLTLQSVPAPGLTSHWPACSPPTTTPKELISMIDELQNSPFCDTSQKKAMAQIAETQQRERFRVLLYIQINWPRSMCSLVATTPTACMLIFFFLNLSIHQSPSLTFFLFLNSLLYLTIVSKAKPFSDCCLTVTE